MYYVYGTTTVMLPVVEFKMKMHSKLSINLIYCSGFLEICIKRYSFYFDIELNSLETQGAEDTHKSRKT